MSQLRKKVVLGICISLRFVLVHIIRISQEPLIKYSIVFPGDCQCKQIRHAVA